MYGLLIEGAGMEMSAVVLMGGCLLLGSSPNTFWEDARTS